MKVLVVLRSVVDGTDELPIVDGQLDEDEAQLTTNEFDEYALEEALRLKETAGATVVVAAPASAGNRILHTGLARGADRAFRLEADVPFVGGSFALSAAVSAFATQLEVDLVMTGVQASDDIFGQLAPLAAARLGWPQASGVVSVDNADGGSVIAVQELEGGRSATLSIGLPAVLGVQTSRQAPRYVSATRLKQVQAATIETSTMVGAEQGSAKLIEIARPASASQVQMLSDDPETAAAELVGILTAPGM